MNEKNIYPNLKKEMERYQHTGAALAAIIDCSPIAVYHWLSGVRQIDVYFAVKIAKVYDRTVDYLFWRGGDQ